MKKEVGWVKYAFVIYSEFSRDREITLVILSSDLMIEFSLLAWASRDCTDIKDLPYP
jgi:hypothetical protein